MKADVLVLPESCDANALAESHTERAAPPTPSPEPRPHGLLRTVWVSMNLALLASFLCLLVCALWNYRTTVYLKGFSDAIVPASGSPERKVQAILDWMAHAPSRAQGSSAPNAPHRDPAETLNSGALLRVCGSATNAFINLADSAGIPARRLLLLGTNGRTKHVVAEALIGSRWVIVDPAYRTILRAPDGSLLTLEQVRDPRVFTAATASIPGYPPEYSYGKTSHIRARRLGFAGVQVEHALSRIAPRWEELPMVSLVLERSSLAAMLASFGVFFFLLLLWAALRPFAETRLRIRPIRVRVRMLMPARNFLESIK